jgi:phosphoribosylglycinamide formyltransferase-1
MTKKKFAVLASGNGTNLQAIIDAVNRGDITAELVLVISDRAQAKALERAERAGIPYHHISPKMFSSNEDYDKALLENLDRAGVDFVVLAGYMRILQPVFIKAYENRILNIHPSFLPNFKGNRAIRDAFEFGATETGVTVHYVINEVDAGPIILQEKVPIKEGDNERILEERVHEVEHKLYPKAIQMYVEGRIPARR